MYIRTKKGFPCFSEILFQCFTLFLFFSSQFIPFRRHNCKKYSKKEKTAHHNDVLLPLHPFVFYRRNIAMASLRSSLPNTAEPATSTWAPACVTKGAVSGVMPPST